RQSSVVNTRPVHSSGNDWLRPSMWMWPKLLGVILPKSSTSTAMARSLAGVLEESFLVLHECLQRFLATSLRAGVLSALQCVPAFEAQSLRYHERRRSHPPSRRGPAPDENHSAGA